MKSCPSKIIHIDTETTGLDPVECDIWQLAAIVEIDGKVEEEMNFLIKPRQDTKFEKKAMELQGTTEAGLREKLENAPDASEVYLQFQQKLGRYISKFNKQDKFLVSGYFVRFDTDHLREFFKKQNDKYYGSWFFSATFDIAGLVGLYACEYNVHFPNFKLTTVCKQMGIELDAHDAMSDIRATRILFIALRGLLGGRSQKT